MLFVFIYVSCSAGMLAENQVTGANTSRDRSAELPITIRSELTRFSTLGFDRILYYAPKFQARRGGATASSANTTDGPTATPPRHVTPRCLRHVALLNPMPEDSRHRSATAGSATRLPARRASLGEHRAVLFRTENGVSSLLIP